MWGIVQERASTTLPSRFTAAFESSGASESSQVLAAPDVHAVAREVDDQLSDRGGVDEPFHRFADRRDLDRLLGIRDRHQTIAGDPLRGGPRGHLADAVLDRRAAFADRQCCLRRSGSPRGPWWRRDFVRAVSPECSRSGDLVRNQGFDEQVGGQALPDGVGAAGGGLYRGCAAHSPVAGPPPLRSRERDRPSRQGRRGDAPAERRPHRSARRTTRLQASTERL